MVSKNWYRKEGNILKQLYDVILVVYSSDHYTWGELQKHREDGELRFAWSHAGTGLHLNDKPSIKLPVAKINEIAALFNGYETCVWCKGTGRTKIEPIKCDKENVEMLFGKAIDD